MTTPEDLAELSKLELIAEVKRQREGNAYLYALAEREKRRAENAEDRVRGFEAGSAKLAEFYVAQSWGGGVGLYCDDHESLLLEDRMTADQIGTAIIGHLREVHGLDGIRHAPCRSEFVAPGQSERAALHICRGRVGHEGMHSDGVAAWGDGAALDNHPAEALLIRVSELVSALRIVTRQREQFHSAYSALWTALEEIREIAADDTERPELLDTDAARLNGIAGVLAAIPDWARPSA